MRKYYLKALLCTLAIGLAITASAHAALVTWDLNPSNANGPVGSTSFTFTSSGFSITAYGFDRAAGPDTGHELWVKDDGSDHGLGLAGTAHNELQVGPN